MDLTQSFQQDDDTVATTPSPSVSNVPMEDLLLIDAHYDVEEAGHRVSTPVVSLRCRQSNGHLRNIEVEGFRPFFYLPRSEFVQDPLKLLNDRRVYNVELEVVPEYWATRIEAIERDHTPEQVADMLSEIGATPVSHTASPMETLEGDSLVTIYATEPGHIGSKDGRHDPLRDVVEDDMEADVPFVRRFLIATEIYRGLEAPTDGDRFEYYNAPADQDDGELCQEIDSCEAPDIEARVCTYDIEVMTNNQGIPDPNRARMPITAISAHDSYEDELHLWALGHDDWGDEDALVTEIVEGANQRFDADVEADRIHVFDKETPMLDDFHSWFNRIDPDIVTGWNSDYFDHPYMIQRSYKMNARGIVDWAVGDANPGVWTEEFDGDEEVGFQIKGRSTLDMLDAYKKTQFRELSSYKLDAVAEAELGVGKVGFDGDDLDRARREEPREFLIYSIRDTQATREIAEAVELVPLYENLREVTGALYDTCNNNGPMLDTLFLRRAYEKGLGLPTNKEPEEGAYHGAKVFDPEPGRHENCVYPDLSSMYPSLFQMLNLGKETILGDEQDLKESQYSEEDVYRVPIDRRDFKIVPKGQEYTVTENENEVPRGSVHVDPTEYKGVKSQKGGTRDMFDPEYHDLYVLKPDIKESFVSDTIDDLVDLKYKYSGKKYEAVKRVTNSCFTPDTEVMTPNGVQNIRDIEVGETVYSLNPETHEMELKEVTELIEKPDYDGELVSIQNNAIDLKVTPDHRIYNRRPRHSDDFESTDAGDLNGWSNYEMVNEWNEKVGGGIETVDLTDYVDSDFDVVEKDGEEYICATGGRGGHEPIKRYYNPDEMARLLGWFATEGYARVESGAYVEIAQKTEGLFQDVSSALECTGRYVRSGDNGFKVHNLLFAEAMVNLCGNTSAEKRLPEWIFDMTVENRHLLRKVLMDGDGDVDADRFSTQSTELRDQFLQLCWELGDPAQYNEDSDVWRVYFGEKKQSFRMKRSGGRTGDGRTETAENGVYCVQVEDNHMLVAGRNGKFSHVPNCYGVMGDSDSAGGKGFRLFNIEVAEPITLAGRMVITHTAKEFTRYLNEHYCEGDAYIVGGDTDSAVTSIQHADTLREAFEWAEDAVEHTEESYDDYVLEAFDFAPDDEHRLAVELESLASALFYMRDMDSDDEDEAVKKRYAQHLVWDDDDGWLDTPDEEEYPGDVLDDSEDLSELKYEAGVDYRTYETGPLADQEPESNVGITGFEYVRSDTAPITKEAQLQILTDILLSDTPMDHIEPYIRDLVDDVRSGDRSIADCARPKGVSKRLDDYGWKSVEELEADENYEVTETDESNGGRYVATPGPTYRGAKYADDSFEWEELGEGSKPKKIPIEKVRGNDYDAAYLYDSYPQDDRPNPPEYKRPVDAVAVENPERLPDDFVVDWDHIVEKELEGKLEGILGTFGQTWDEAISPGQQTGLDAFA